MDYYNHTYYQNEGTSGPYYENRRHMKHHPGGANGRRRMSRNPSTDQSSSYGYYHDSPLTHYRRTSYYKEEPSLYAMESPRISQYEEDVYLSPKSRRSSRPKHNEYPKTPEDGRSFIYTQGEENNENHIDFNAGAENLTAAYQEHEMYSNDPEPEEEEEEDQDPTTQMNTLFNADSKSMPNYTTTASPTSLNNEMHPTTVPTPVTSPPQPPQKKKWFQNMTQVVKKQFNKIGNNNKKNSVIVTEGSPRQPEIQFISASDNVGDVLDAQQQKEIFTQLSTPLAPSSYNMSPETAKITNLDRIWVFRLMDNNLPEAEEDRIAWIGFDYENQIKIEEHLKQVHTLPENERFAVFYDSHIRHQKMPVIVTPNENKGYYFAEEDQKTLVTLQVTFIENHNQKVTFVYRV